MLDYNINIDTQVRSLMKVLDDLRKGYIQIPPFQRDFVWEQDNVRELFDSIKNNYPIGSILLWKPEKPYDWTSVNNISGIPLPQSSGTPLYILDGCQRLSTLFGCLTNPNKTIIENQVIWKEKFELFYDLEEESFIYIGNRKAKAYQIPLYIFTSTSDFRQYTRKYLDPQIKDEDKLNLYLERADIFSRTLIEYKLAVIEVNNAKLEQAVEIFSRINSKGTEITYDWTVNALSYNNNSGFRFATEMETLLVRLEKYNFGDYSRNNLFRCYQSAFDSKLYIDQQNLTELAKRDNFENTVKYTSKCIEKAVDFLFNRLHIVDTRLLPYNMQLIFITAFFKKINNPTEFQLNIIEQWFWKTTYSNYFTIYSLSNQRKAYKHFLDFLDGKENTPLYIDGNMRPPFKTLSFPKQIYLSSVRCKALILFQIKQQSLCGIKNFNGNLRYYKIDKNSDNTPQNIIPYISVGIKETFIEIFDKSLPNKILINKSNPYCLPIGEFDLTSEKDYQDFLSKRLFLLQEQEELFVEKLELEYSKGI